MTPQEIISDEDIVRVHAHANFGAMSPREVVNEGVRKTAVGYHCGSTQLHILLEHGLATKPRPGSSDISLTKKGKAYARSIYRDASPARAEALDEGAAGSFEERAVMLTKKHGNPVGTDYEQGQNDMGYRMVTMAREADAALALARAHPSPPPAADEDRVRIAELEGAIRFARFQLNDGQGDCVFYNLGSVLPEVVAQRAADAEALAALKSTADGQATP